jgi:hypothetical protein
LSGSLRISRTAIVFPKYLAGDVSGEQSGVNVRDPGACSIAPSAVSGYDRSLFVLGLDSQKDVR